LPKIVETRSLCKHYTRGAEVITPLEEIDLAIEEGEFLSLMGPSGSGKTTLLNIIAGIDSPTSGEVVVAGSRLDTLSDSALATWRLRSVGYIFQMYNLVPVLTAWENVELPLLLLPLSRSERRKHVDVALTAAGIADRGAHFPRQLSGGQEQRVAIARAIVTDPKIIVADEPTGDLDATGAEEILKLLRELCDRFEKTFIMVTHDPDAATIADRTVYLHKGVLQDTPRTTTRRESGVSTDA
jgi:putative ABC transport system ATP-binding protein